MFSDYIIPGIMLIIILYALIKGTPVFSAFTQGAKDGLKNMYAIAPSLIGLVTAVGMLKASGAVELITSLCEPVTS
ncbi:MAG: spore maturation protein, partial [Clostridia bacterium]|nr:spore maturation protein [Clostridia bacterium]